MRASTLRCPVCVQFWNVFDAEKEVGRKRQQRQIDVLVTEWSQSLSVPACEENENAPVSARERQDCFARAYRNRIFLAKLPTTTDRLATQSRNI